MEAVIAPDQSISPCNKRHQIKAPKRSTRYHTMKPSENNNNINKSNRSMPSLGRVASLPLPQSSNPLSSFSYNGHNRFPQPNNHLQLQPQSQPPLLPLPILHKPPTPTQYRSRSRDVSTSPVFNRKLTARKPAKPVTSAASPVKPTKQAVEPSSAVAGPLGPEPDELPNAIFTLAPPPSSLPLPRFSLRPKLGCNVEAGVDVGATDNLRRLLRLP